MVELARILGEAVDSIGDSIGDYQRERLSVLLRKFRAENNFSGRELARRMKMNPASVSAWIDKTNYPSPESRRKIAKALNMTPLELESYLADVAVRSIEPLEQIKQELRAMSRSDFQEVLGVVFERVQNELRLTT